MVRCTRGRSLTRRRGPAGCRGTFRARPRRGHCPRR
jgi:hypothetical protein